MSDPKRIDEAKAVVMTLVALAGIVAREKAQRKQGPAPELVAA